jgi:protein involved in polysaccharide export with SLBB domain
LIKLSIYYRLVFCAAVLVLFGCKSTSNASFEDPAKDSGAVAIAGQKQPAPVSSVEALPSRGVAIPVGNASGKAPSDEEVIKVGDTLIISFADTPNPLPAFEIKVPQEGTISLLYNKPFIVIGKTRSQVQREIRAVYVPDYFKNLTVIVVHQSSTRFFYVGGEVKLQGRVIYAGPITVTRAIQSAGDFTDFAQKKKVRLTRANGHTEIINCIKALTNPSMDKEVYPGDQIHVPRKLF